MQYLGYDQESKEFLLKMSKQDFLDVLTVVGRVCETPELQDFTALGTYTLERTQEVAAALREVKEKAIDTTLGNECTFRMPKRDFLDAMEVVLNVDDSMGRDLSPLLVTEERVRALGKDMYGILLEDLEVLKSKGRG
jgi:hypothetical protein